MKKVFMAVAMAIFLTGCTGSNGVPGNIASNSNAAESQSHLTQDFKKHYNDFYIGETQFSLPFSYKELMDMGFTDSEGETLIEKGKPHLVTVSNENISMDVYVGYKGNETEALKSEGEVIAVLVKEMPEEGSDSKALKFYGDITLNSSQDDVKQVLDLMEADENGSLYGIKMGEYSYLSVSFQGETIHDIMVVNGEDYFK